MYTLLILPGSEEAAFWSCDRRMTRNFASRGCFQRSFEAASSLAAFGGCKPQAACPETTIAAFGGGKTSPSHVTRPPPAAAVNPALKKLMPPNFEPQKLMPPNPFFKSLCHRIPCPKVIKKKV